jgi:hypothetical protein
MGLCAGVQVFAYGIHFGGIQRAQDEARGQITNAIAGDVHLSARLSSH